MELKKILWISIFLLSVFGVASAGSTYKYKVNTSSEWESGYNVGNTTVINGTLTTPQEFLKFSSKGSPNGETYLFDGSEDFLIINESLELDDAGGTYAVATWVYPKSGTGRGTIFRTNPDGSYTPAIALEYNNSGNNKFRFQYGGSSEEMFSPNSYASGQWYHLAVSYDGSNNVSKMWVNGDLVKEDTSAKVSNRSSNEEIWRIGKYDKNSSSSGGGGYLKGKVDELRYIQETISGSQVDDLYLNNDIDGVTPAFYYAFNESSSPAVDWTPSKLEGDWYGSIDSGVSGYTSGGWRSYQSASAWNVYSGNITQGKNKGFNTSDFKSSQDNSGYIGGVFDGELATEASLFNYNGGETDYIGSGFRYDTVAEGINSNWAYTFSTDSGVSKSITVTCSDGNEHTITWGSDGSDPYIEFDGTRETFSNGLDNWQYNEHSAHDIDCNDVADNEYLSTSTISGDVTWFVGESQVDVAHSDGDGVINLKSEPVYEKILRPGGAYGYVNVSVGTNDHDTVTMVGLSGMLRGETGVATDGESGNDDDVFVYLVSGNKTENPYNSNEYVCQFTNAIAGDSSHTLASLKGNLNFGDGSNDLITVDDDNTFEFLDPRGRGSNDDCQTKNLANPTDGQLTGLASNQRDVDGDGTTELIFTVAGSGSGTNANGYIFHADFDTSGLTDVTNTSIKTSEGDVGQPYDWDADSSTPPYIPFRDPNKNVKIAKYNSSPKSSGRYVSKNNTESQPFEPTNLSIYYDASSNADLDYTWKERGFVNNLDASLEPQVFNDQFCEDCMYDSVTMKFNYSGGSDVSNQLNVNNWTIWGNRFERTAEWNSSVIDSSSTDPTAGMGSYAVPVNFSSNIYDPKTSGSDSLDYHKLNFYVASKDPESSFWNGFRKVKNLDKVEFSNKFTVKAEIVNEDGGGDPRLGNTSKADWFELDYAYPNVPVEVNSFNESMDTSWVQAGEKLIVRTRIYDADGEGDIVEPSVNLTMPDGSSKRLTSGSLVSTSDGYLYEFSVKTDATPSNLGSGTVKGIGEDKYNVFNKSSFEIRDTFSPVYKNLAQGSGEVEESSNNTLSVDTKDRVRVDKVTFWTNNGSGWSKYRTKDVSIEDTYNTVSIEYDTTGLNEADTVKWKAELTDSQGNSKNTSTKSFDIVGVILIDNIELKYRKVGSGIIEKMIVANLDSNYTIDDHASVNADTIKFTNKTWKMENFTIPFNDNLTVNETGGAETTKGMDFNISVKGIRGHPYNADPSYQEKNKTIRVNNSGSTFDLNVSCVNNGYGDPVSGSVDTEVTILGGTVDSHACRWSGDWLKQNYKDADPTVDEIRINNLLPVSRNVYLENNQSVKFPKINVSGFAEPDPTCKTTSNELFSVPANGNNTESVGFKCDIGDSGSPQLIVNSKDGYTKYNFTTKVNVSSDLAENISIEWRFNKSNLEDWGSRDSGSAKAYVKGTTDDILLAESSNYVSIIVPNDAFQSSLHEGQTRESLVYTKGKDSSSGGGAGGGVISDPVTVIKNVTGKYNWSVYAPRSRGQQFFNIVGWGGRDLGNAPTRIVVQNLGSNNFTVEARCVSKDNSCSFIKLSKKEIKLTQLDKREVVKIKGVIPQDMPKGGYRFNIVFEDPANNTITTNFRISKSFTKSLIIRFITKVFGVREVDFDGEGGGRPVPIPLALPVIVSTMLLWGLMALALRFSHSQNMIKDDLMFVRARLIISVIFFILAFVFI